MSGMLGQHGDEDAYTVEESAQLLWEILMEYIHDHQTSLVACITIAVDNVEQKETFRQKFQKWLDKSEEIDQEEQQQMSQEGDATQGQLGVGGKPLV